MIARPQRQSGFTLLEMLLAISLLVLLAALAYGTLRTGVRGWEAADAQADREDALRVGWPFLHQTLEAARTEPDPASRMARFDGGSTRLSWASELPAHFVAGGPRALTLTTERAPDGEARQLLLSSAPLEPESADAADRQQAVLVDDLAEIHIQYYGADGAGGTPGWQSSWRQRRNLPLLVRIDIQPRDAPAWPTLYAHPYLATPAASAAPVDDPEGRD